MPLPPSSRRLGRRRLLRSGLGLGLGSGLGLLGLGGCTSPVVGGGTGNGPGSGGNGGGGNGGGGNGGAGSGPVSPAPPTLAGAAEAAATEAALAATAARLSARTGDDAPSKRQRSILTQLQQAHLAHQQALTSPDPTDPAATGPAPSGPPSGASPSPSSPSSPSSTAGAGTLSSAISALAAAENAAAAGYRDRVSGTEGTVALLWASLAAAADGYADALTSTASRSGSVLGRQRPVLADLTRSAAITRLLGEIDAVLYGYQAARVYFSGSRARTAASRVTAWYRLRDSLRAELVAAGAEPTPAAPAYVLKPDPTGTGSAAALAAALETRIQPFLGQWLRTAADTDQNTDQNTAQSALDAAVAAGLGWGAALNYWPGWAD